MTFGVFQFRRDTAANWTAANPVLLSGELGLETNTKQFKIGDGATAWNALTYGGIQGPQGNPGTNGTNGRGITSITRTNGNGAAGTTDTYTITYTDATTSNFQVVNGANGQSVAVLDEGVSLVSAATSLNFAGRGFTATAAGAAVTITSANHMGLAVFYATDYGTLTDGSDAATVAAGQATTNRTTIQAAINAAQTGVGAKPGGIVLLPPGTYHIDATLTINVSGVRLMGSGRKGNSDVGSQTGHGTTLFWNNTGSSATTAMIDTVSVQGASNAAVKGVGVSMLNLQCAGNVGIGLRVKSIHWGEYKDIYVINATAKGVTTECFVTGTELGEAADVTKCTFDNIGVRMLEVSGTAVGFFLAGASNANTSNSTFRNLAVSCFGTQLAMDLQNTDSNRFYDVAINQSNGGTVQPVRLRGGASSGLECRGNVFYNIACGGSSTGTRGLYSEGTETAGVTAPAKNNVIFGYSIENGEPVPTVGTGSLLTYITVGGSGAAAFQLSAYGGQGPIRPPIPAPTLTNATATLTTEQILAKWAIPGGYITNGMGFTISMSTQTAAASLLTFRVRVGAAGTTADAVVVTFTATAAQAANAYQNVMATLQANTATTVRGGGFVVAQAAVLGTVTAANAAATIAPANTVFVTVTVAEATTAGVVTVIAADMSVGA